MPLVEANFVAFHYKMQNVMRDARHRRAIERRERYTPVGLLSTTRISGGSDDDDDDDGTDEDERWKRIDSNRWKG